ncbi:MAG: thrombospondin type 3 repeat-containing protein [Pseudomonadales bacterium]|nr:thrombospondin type 3 repeat-containing protein [Pseudomonadales bacterium]
MQAPNFDNPVSQLSAGNHHTCAISGGELVCWGFNAYGQTNVPANLPPVEIVKAGANHTCAVAEQRVYCWGLIGDKEIYQQLDEVVELSSGDGFSCAISGNGVYCWGENHSGQLEIPGSDIDMDGVYDRYDPDRDGDGVYNSDDEFPDDPDETHDLDGDKIGDNKDPDRDGDGVANNLDLFPDDADEFFDIDGDGQGDNQDIDRDGDGVFNHFDPDRDGDGVLNEADFAPDDALNVSDLDGDGIGDSFDSDWDGDGLENSNDPDPTSTQLYKPSKVVVGGSAAKNNAFGCAIDGTGVSCWGRQRSKIIPNESIAAPSDIAVVDSTKICVIDTNRIICWGDYPRNDFYEKVPRPKRFVSNQDQVCVHTDEGLYCPRNKQTPLTDSKFIEPFYNREDIFCGWKKAELVCRGYSYLSERFDEFTLPEELINPTILSLSKQGLSCAIDRSQLKCWDRYWNGYNEVEVIHGPKLLHPIDMQLYNNDVCAADDYGIRCWERIYETPHPYNGFKLAENFNIRLSKVTSYDLTSNYGCAISAGEIHCWGELVSPGKDTDGDGIEDVNDKDLDGDGIENRRDAFRFDPLEWSDLDQDGIGDNSDTDLDGDQLNNENDPDIDNDGIANEEDLAPYSKAPAKIRFIQADNDFTSCEIGEQIVRCSEDNYFPIHIKHKPHFSVNDYRYCAIVDKVVQCWDTDYTQTIPLPNNLSFSDPKAITLGQGHTCVIDGINIVCWGNNRFGQLEIPSGIDEPLLIAAGSKHTCATAESGVVCWGNNEHGQLDAPANLNKVTLLSSAKDYNCAVANNELSCWGSIDWEVPKQLENPVVLSLSDDYFCALDDLGVRCWGKSFWKTKLNAPKTLFNPVDVSVNRNKICALDSTGVHCW